MDMAIRPTKKTKIVKHGSKFPLTKILSPSPSSTATQDKFTLTEWPKDDENDSMKMMMTTVAPPSFTVASENLKRGSVLKARGFNRRRGSAVGLGGDRSKWVSISAICLSPLLVGGDRRCLWTTGDSAPCCELERERERSHEERESK
uniref:Uncharacterized protein n=1 Tax=Fagus sylvatica TaxID=28930 RepID=A0A2N9IDZ4_FAGSY